MKQFKISWLSTVTNQWLIADKICAESFEEARSKLIEQIKKDQGVAEDKIEKDAHGLLVKEAKMRAVILEDKNAV
jgi:hypothetical protein